MNITDLGRTVTFSLSMEVFDWSFLAMMAGQEDIQKEAFAIMRRQTGVATTQVELLGVPRSGSLSVRPFNATKGSFTGAEMEAGIDYTLEGSTITFTNGIGEEVLIAYFEEGEHELITFNADKFPPSYYIVGDFEYREAATGADKWAQLHILNARPQADLSLSLGSEVTTLDITFDALADGRGDIFHIVKIDEDVELGGGGTIGADFGTGTGSGDGDGGQE